jgi:hypothetical protein
VFFREKYRIPVAELPGCIYNKSRGWSKTVPPAMPGTLAHIQAVWNSLSRFEFFM